MTNDRPPQPAQLLSRRRATCRLVARQFVETNSQARVRRQRRPVLRPMRSDARTQHAMMESLGSLVILIVEDDDDARELMQAVLEQRGATVAAAASVARAFELLGGTAPDVIVSDIAMPDEDGFALARRLRALPPDGGGLTPIIAVSAYAASSDRARALAAGFDRYLHKPVDFDELSVTIKSVVSGSAQRSA
ncbi:MAG: response regulator [Labilithrix sp.]|nr:response regulator [Labilithrix sp.]